MEIEQKKSNYMQKNFNEKLEKSSKIFTLLGLVLALFVVYIFIEYETKQIRVSILNVNALNENQEFTASVLFTKEVVLKEIIEKKHEEEIKEVTKEILDLVKPVPDIIDPPEVISKAEKAVVHLDSINEIDIPETIYDDFPLILVDEVPVFPGCVGNSKELRACLAKNVKKHVYRKFNSGLGEEAGLSSGKKKIFVMFKIDATGNIIDVEAKASHPSLKKEAERVVKSLPKMKPGKQKGRPVGVRYALPISFEVQ